MTTANHPENQKPNGPNDLGQISKGKGAISDLIERRKSDPLPRANNPRPWVIVEQAGTDDESIRADFGQFSTAHRACLAWYSEDELETLGVSIMKRNNDGTLTTEY
jgi:hypothetical protein